MNKKNFEKELGPDSKNIYVVSIRIAVGLIAIFWGSWGMNSGAVTHSIASIIVGFFICVLGLLALLSGLAGVSRRHKKSLLRTDTRSLFTSIVIGTVTGYVGGPVFVLTPWAVMGLIIGWFSAGKKAALVNGALYGFALGFAFMVAGYTGTAPIVTKLLPFAVLGLFGALYGTLWSIVGKLLHERFIK